MVLILLYSGYMLNVPFLFNIQRYEDAGAFLSEPHKQHVNWGAVNFTALSKVNTSSGSVQFQLDLNLTSYQVRGMN